MRMEFVQMAGSANRATQGIDISGMYMIMNDADSSYSMVMPSQRMATIMPSPSLMLPDRAKPSVDVNSTTRSIEDLGPGEKILGHATHRYRVQTTGSVTMRLGDGEECTRATDGETEMWIAPDLDIRPAMASMLSHYGGLAPDVTASGSSALPKGLALRSKTRHQAVLPTGESRVIETTVEYVELSNAPLDASVFSIPADYHVMDMRKEMPDILAKAGDLVSASAATHAKICPQ
jgi:hypothetical protein